MIYDNSKQCDVNSPPPALLCGLLCVPLGGLLEHVLLTPPLVLHLGGTGEEHRDGDTEQDANKNDLDCGPEDIVRGTRADPGSRVCRKHTSNAVDGGNEQPGTERQEDHCPVGAEPELAVAHEHAAKSGDHDGEGHEVRRLAQPVDQVNVRVRSAAHCRGHDGHDGRSQQAELLEAADALEPQRLRVDRDARCYVSLPQVDGGRGDEEEGDGEENELGDCGVSRCGWRVAFCQQSRPCLRSTH